MTYQEFVELYQKYGKTPLQINPPKNTLNEKQLKSAYKKYLKREEKREEKIIQSLVDERWEKVKKEVWDRDRGKCQLTPLLTAGELIIFLEKSGHLKEIIDPAHIYGKGAYPFLKYDPENVVLLNRYSHSMLDTYRSPVDGSPISQAEHTQWWCRIVGTKRYMRLEEKLRSEY